MKHWLPSVNGFHLRLWKCERFARGARKCRYWWWWTALIALITPISKLKQSAKQELQKKYTGPGPGNGVNGNVEVASPSPWWLLLLWSRVKCPAAGLPSLVQSSVKRNEVVLLCEMWSYNCDNFSRLHLGWCVLPLDHGAGGQHCQVTPILTPDTDTDTDTDPDTDPDTAATWSSHSSTSSPLPPATRLRSGARVKLYYWHSSVIRQKIIPGSFSTLVVSFHLQRHMGDFVIQVSKTYSKVSSPYIVKILRNSVVDTSSIKIWWQVYGPCILLVVISWVSFWLNREATSDRISLGT